MECIPAHCMQGHPGLNTPATHHQDAGLAVWFRAVVGKAQLVAPAANMHVRTYSCTLPKKEIYDAIVVYAKQKSGSVQAGKVH